MPEGVQEGLAVRIVLQEGFLLVAAGGNMMDCTGVFSAEGDGAMEGRKQEIG